MGGTGRGVYRVEVGGVGLQVRQLHMVQQGGAVVQGGVGVGEEGVVHKPCNNSSGNSAIAVIKTAHVLPGMLQVGGDHKAQC